MSNEQYLEHHGILGQKWGVRRYQNFDGTYTQAGLKRYNNSKSAYEKSKEAYKTVKQLHKTGMVSKDENGEEIHVNISKNVVKESKGVMKQAKRQMNKDYKHLKQDKLADKGKARYANGETITNNHAVSGAMTKIGSLTLSAAAIGYNYQLVDKKVATAIAEIGAATVTGGVIYGLGKERANKQLRAYYGHTSNY